MYNCFFNADSFIVFSGAHNGASAMACALLSSQRPTGLNIYLYSSLNENLCGLCLSQKLAKPFDWLLRPHATASKDMLCVLFIYRALCASASLR